MSGGLWSVQVVEMPSARRGVVLLVGSTLYVGTLAPTPTQRYVMDALAAAFPWLRDPLRSDPMAALRALPVLSDPSATLPA